ncbi:hypothetical protein LINPERHAP1_LOCUS27064, partial [Linum perenne]
MAALGHDITEICNEPCRDFLNLKETRMTEAIGSSSDDKRGRLNPEAEEWSPGSGRAPEKNLCLYLTFSMGYPIPVDQLVRFFTRRFGPCVERVYVHTPPLFGKIQFTASYMPALILNGEDEVRFTVGGRIVSCKKFSEFRRGNND